MRPLLGLLVLATLTAAHAQSPAEALRSSARTLTAADLPEGYRAVSLGTGNDAFGGLGFYAMGFASRGESPDEAQTSLLFSLMNASFVDPDEFAELLEGKRPRIRAYALDLTATLTGSARNVRAPKPVFSENWIEAGRVLQWSPRPALTKAALVAAFGGPNSPGNAPAALANVKQIALSLIMYSADSDDRLPKADSTAKARALVKPYLKDDSLWTTSSGGRILYNVALSGVDSAAIADPAATLLVWEEKPTADGMRAVAFTDGHAKRVSEAEWTSIWTAELSRRKAGPRTGARAIRSAPSPTTAHP